MPEMSIGATEREVPRLPTVKAFVCLFQTIISQGFGQKRSDNLWADRVVLIVEKGSVFEDLKLKKDEQKI